MVYLAVFAGYTGQQILTPLLPPLARDLALSEIQFGVVMSASAAVVALVSPLWGRQRALGRHSLLTGSLVGAAIGLAAFAATVQLGLAGVLSAGAVFALLLLSRGVLFGAALAALPVSAQSYVADLTPTTQDRVTGLARVGAAVGLGLVLRPGLGVLLAGFGVTVAMYAAPLLLAVFALVVGLLLPRDRPRHASEVPLDRTARLRFTDARVWPFFVAGGGIYLSTSLLQMSIAFLLQDRLGLDTARTVELAGLALLAGGVPMLVVQAWVIPQLGWGPLRLMRVGVPITASAFAAIAVLDSLPLLILAVIVSGVGHSLAIPGYVSGASLHVGPAEQGQVAGLVGSVNAATLVVGPLAATALYSLGAALPFAVGAVVLLVLFGFLLTHTGVRSPADGE